MNNWKFTKIKCRIINFLFFLKILENIIIIISIMLYNLKYWKLVGFRRKALFEHFFHWFVYTQNDINGWKPCILFVWLLILLLETSVKFWPPLVCTRVSLPSKCFKTCFSCVYLVRILPYCLLWKQYSSTCPENMQRVGLCMREMTAAYDVPMHHVLLSIPWPIPKNFMVP